MLFTTEIFSGICSIANEYEIKIGGVNKLVQNLGNQSKYVVYTEIFSGICH